jgi:SAM-dependent methyltransferase
MQTDLKKATMQTRSRMKQAPDDFYRSYSTFKRYQTPTIKPKHIRWYDREFWIPTRCTRETSVLELGSGPGEFLAYLDHKGVSRFRGIEMDRNAVAVMPVRLQGSVQVSDIWSYLDSAVDEQWDRVVMLDVLEHFSASEGVWLLEQLKRVLSPGGLVIARVPNMGSPWGAIHQYADITHKAAYTAVSLEQLGIAAGYEVESFLPYRRGTPVRRFLEDCLNGLLARMLTVSPVIWTANIIVIYRVRAP